MWHARNRPSMRFLPSYWAAAAALLGYPALGALRLVRMETAWLAVALVVLSNAVAMVGSDAAAPPPLVDAGARNSSTKTHWKLRSVPNPRRRTMPAMSLDTTDSDKQTQIRVQTRVFVSRRLVGTQPSGLRVRIMAPGSETSTKKKWHHDPELVVYVNLI